MKISYTQFKTYKACRRLYELSYVEGLKYNKSIEPLEAGVNYHNKIEQLYNTGDFERTGDKTDAMAEVYRKYIFPRFKVLATEQWFEYPLGRHLLVGRVDAVAEGGWLVEHKTTSGEVGDEYLYNLQWDEQILFYLLTHGVFEMYYTVTKKPTIRQKQNESLEEYIARCVEWYDTDTAKKIGLFKISRTPEEIEAFKEQLIVTLNEVEQNKLYFRNPNNCTCFGRRCEYSQICLNYNPEMEYIDFIKKYNTEEI